MYGFTTVPESDIILLRHSNTYRSVICLTSSLPEASITFLDPHGQPAGPDMIPYYGTLTVSSETTQSGVWICHAENGAGTLEHSFTIHIQGKNDLFQPVVIRALLV